MAQFDFGRKEDGKYDVVLRAEGREFFVMRGHLGTYSPELHDRLCGDGNNVNKEQVLKLDGVTADGVQVVLELINGCNRINDGNVEGAVQCARKWEARLPLRACEEYLMENSELDKKTMFGLADKYKLLMLKAQLFKRIASKAELESMIPDDLRQLQHDSLVLVLQKARSFLREAPAPSAPVVGPHAFPVQHGPALVAARNADPAAELVPRAQVFQMRDHLRGRLAVQDAELRNVRFQNDDLMRRVRQLEDENRLWRELSQLQAMERDQRIDARIRNELAGQVQLQALRVEQQAQLRQQHPLLQDPMQAAQVRNGRRNNWLRERMARMQNVPQRHPFNHPPMQMVQRHDGQGDVGPAMRPQQDDLPPRDAQ